MCVYYCLQDLVQSCLRGEGGDIGGHVLRETTSRGLCGLVCPSHTSEHWGDVYYCSTIRGVCILGVCVYVCVYYCSTYYKAVRGRVEDMCYERLRAEASVN